MERKYSVAEIDALRAAVHHKYLWGRYDPSSLEGPSGTSRTYNEHEKDREVERQVRALMLAGHTADDLIAAERAGRHVSVLTARDGGAAGFPAGYGGGGSGGASASSIRSIITHVLGGGSSGGKAYGLGSDGKAHVGYGYGAGGGGGSQVPKADPPKSSTAS